MKNKIYEAFDSIKLDANIKKEALDNITKVKEEGKYKYINYRRLVYGVFVLGLFTVLILTNQEMITSNKYEPQNVSEYGSESFNDIINYQGNNYYLTSEDASEFVLHNQLGPLKDFIVSDVVKNGIDTYDGNKATVYSSNDDDVLLVKMNDQILVYRKTNR